MSVEKPDNSIFWGIQTLKRQRKVLFWRLVHGCGVHKRKIRVRGECWGLGACCHAGTHKMHFPCEGLLEGPLLKLLVVEWHWKCFISLRLSVILVVIAFSPSPQPLEGRALLFSPHQPLCPASRGEEPGLMAGGRGATAGFWAGSSSISMQGELRWEERTES